MIRSKFTDRICIGIVVLALVFTILFCYTDALGVQAAEVELGYETRLFDDTRMHTLDIQVDVAEWEQMLSEAASKTYIPCTLVIDGETIGNAAIRPKGNTSLSSVSSMGSQRYSFKVEFDHYVSGQTYHGLDKLSLNNLIYDTTYLKDYLVYDMMNYIGADAPLSSFVNITVNGEAWGLYLAVEGIEEAFLQRNYGSDYGELYKPDSMQLRNDMQDMRLQFQEGDGAQAAAEGEQPAAAPDATPEAGGDLGDFEPPADFDPGDMDFGDFEFPADFDPEDMGTPPEGMEFGGGKGGGFGGGPGRSGSSDVALQYIDDDPDSYSNIFDSAKTDITPADQTRLIASLKQLSTGQNLEEVVDIDEVLRYFVAHNFVVSFDSYTGTMTHNYYLYEEDGRLSMIAWDYNLAFGTFSGGGSGDAASSAVNYPIDTPVSGTTLEDRPLLGQLLANETYLEQYHAIFDEFISGYFESGHFEQVLEQAISLISPYVEQDPSAFYSYEEFQTGVEALRTFCQLRAQSVRGQLDGTIPATEAGQQADSSALVDTGSLSLSDLGSMNMGGRGGGFGGDRGGQMPGDRPERSQAPDGATKDAGNAPAEQAPPEGQPSDAPAQGAANGPPEAAPQEPA